MCIHSGIAIIVIASAVPEYGTLPNTLIEHSTYLHTIRLIAF